MRCRFVSVSAGLVLGLLAAVVAQAGGGGGVTALSAPAQAQPPAVVIPDPVFEYDGGSSGTNFNGSRVVQRNSDLNAIKDLSEGIIVASFHVDRYNPLNAIVSASNKYEPGSEFCFCIAEGAHGAFAREDNKVVNLVRSVRTAYGAGRVTAVLSVSESDGTFLMSSQDLGATHRDSSVNSFFSSVDGINSLLIGGNDDNKWGYEMHMRGTIYFVEIYSTPFTEELAEAKIKESSLSFPGGVSYIRTGERTFQFGIQPPIGDLEATYRWEFPGRPGGPATAPRAGMISTQQRPTWTAPTGSLDPFKDDVPAKVTVMATISSLGAHYGYTETMTLYVAPDAGSGTAGRSPYFETWVFKHGEDGFGCFRVPAIVRAGNGDLLVFIEARPRLAFNRRICYDHQDGISVVMKRSVDDGRTWGPLQVIAENITTTGRRLVAQNVTAVLDETDPDYQEGKIVIVYSAAEVYVYDSVEGSSVRRVMTAWSGDHGHTWNWDKITSPAGTYDGDITNQVSYPYAPDYTAVYDADYAAANYNKRRRTIHVTNTYDASSDAWALVMPTLGHSIQLKHGNSTKGRLFISGVYSPISESFQTFNYVFWSDDHGKTWEIGGQIESAPTYHLNEATAVELENGDVLINSRAYIPDRWTGALFLRNVSGRVLTTASFDSEGKVSFSTPTREYDLTTAGIGIAAGMTRMTTSDQTIFGGKSRIAFTAPNDQRKHRGRSGMSFWMSTDEGERWNAYGSEPKLLNSGPSVYSDIIALPDARVGILYHGSKK